jgi:very-short-patch-repair endonuclease
MRIDSNRAIVEVAAKQHGLFTRTQARAAGASDKVVRRRVRAGHWVARAPRVLAVAGSPDTPVVGLLIAVLEVGCNAAASHRAAAALHGIPGFDLRELHVTRPPGRTSKQLASGRLHVVPLPPDHVTVVDGVPTTTVPRTLFDLAATERHERRVERALDNALAMRLTSVSACHELVEASKGRPGVRRMRELLAVRMQDYVAPASELEARFLELVRAADLPEPERQVHVGGAELAGRVDMTWRDACLVVQLDSRRHHSARLDASEDMRRDAAAAAGGWRTMRVTWEDVFVFPERTMDRLRSALRDEAAMRRAG